MELQANDHRAMNQKANEVQCRSRSGRRCVNEEEDQSRWKISALITRRPTHVSCRGIVNRQMDVKDRHRQQQPPPAIVLQ